MTAVTHDSPGLDRITTNRIGMWLFIVSESFLFAGLLIARIALLGNTHPHINQMIGLGITSILLISSFFVNRAEVAISYNDRGQFLVSLLITIILGLVFVVGVGYEWSIAEEGVDTVNGAIFFSMTGMHALHVISGLVMLIIVYLNGQDGHYSAEAHWGVEATVLYWHFVDVVWVFFYAALYLIGTAPIT